MSQKFIFVCIDGADIVCSNILVLPSVKLVQGTSSRLLFVLYLHLLSHFRIKSVEVWLVEREAEQLLVVKVDLKLLHLSLIFIIGLAE